MMNTIQELTYERIMAFLYENDVTHAVELLYDAYKIAWKHIDKDSQFILFDNTISRLLLDKIKQNNIKNTEDIFANLDYIKIILKIAAVTKDEGTLSALRNFIMGLGNCISIRLKNGDIYDKHMWGKYFGYLLGKGPYIFSDDIADDEVRAEYVKQFYLLAFNYCYGLIRNGITDVVKDSFYSFFIKVVNIDLRQVESSKYIIFLAIAVHSFLFYLANLAKHVSKEEQEFARSIIYDKAVKESLYIFMGRLRGRKELSTIITKNFEKELNAFLLPYKIIDDKSREFLLEPTANRFFTFFIGYITEKFSSPDMNLDMNLLDSALDIDRVRYYLDRDHINDTKKLLQSFTNLLSINQIFELRIPPIMISITQKIYVISCLNG